MKRDLIDLGLEVKVIPDANRLNQKTKFSREFLANAPDPCQQLPARLRIGKRHQPVANVQRDDFYLINIFPIQLTIGRLDLGDCLGVNRLFLLLCCLLSNVIAQTNASSAQGQEDKVGHAGNEPQQGHNPGSNEDAIGIGDLL